MLAGAELRGACAQATDAHPTAAREILDLSRARVARILRCDSQSLLLQELPHEFQIARADIAELRDHAGAAEDLDLQVLARAAGAEDAVDQQFHRGSAVACRPAGNLLPGIRAAAVRPRQHEMVHAADAEARIADARRDTRAQHGFDDFVLARHVVLARQDAGARDARCISMAADRFEAGQSARQRLARGASSCHELRLRFCDRSSCRRLAAARRGCATTPHVRCTSSRPARASR